MPYRPKDIYRGRRKFRVPLNIFLFVLSFAVFGSIALFYGLRLFVVYVNSGVSLQLPWEREAQTEEEAVIATPEPTFEPVQVQVVWEDPDFSDVDLGGWEDLAPIKARYFPLAEVTNPSSLGAAVSAVQTGDYTTAIFEMKARSGQLAWPSSYPTALSYATAGTTDVTDAIAELHAAGKTVAAQISCFADELLAERNWTVTFMLNGRAYADGDGIYWLDPYNRTVRAYITGLVEELAAMGFDEIILADLYHPVQEGLSYSSSGTLQTPPNPVVAVCQMGRRIVETLQDTGVAVSARINGTSLRLGMGAQTGQDIGIFWRLFARLYCPSDYGIVESDMELAVESMNRGDANIRFVPICPFVPEDVESYVLVTSW